MPEGGRAGRGSLEGRVPGESYPQLTRRRTPCHWLVDTAGQSAVHVDYFYVLAISLGCMGNQFLS